MCGRYSFTLPPDAIRELFRVMTGLNLQPRYNIAPTQQAPVIGLDEEGARALKMYRWGLIPRWSKALPTGAPMINAPLINARAESIAEKPAFRDAFRKRRCLVPADGFYEWPKDKASKDRRPWRIFAADRPAFAFAGIWEAWRNPQGGPEGGGAGDILRSFAIVTTDANARIAGTHDRMPVILRREDEDAWLAPETALERLLGMLAPYPAELTELYRVDSRVNSVRNDDPDCIKPLE
jgi:putative SOS response-associated peptidase YedK